jgi:hypothetical protein
MTSYTDIKAGIIDAWKEKLLFKNLKQKQKRTHDLT